MFNIIIYFTTKQFYTQCYNFIEHVTAAPTLAPKTSTSLSIESAVTSHGKTTQEEGEESRIKTNKYIVMVYDSHLIK